jgi:ketosteroid isomerase-like protein
MKDWEIFLDKYRAFGDQPSRETHARLFASDATIRHPGMKEPMPAARYVDFIVEGLKRLHDFHLIPIHWAVNGDTIFVEARNTAVVNGHPIEWPATYVVTLRGEMVVRGHAYYDRSEVLMHFDAALSSPRPNAHRALLSHETPQRSSPIENEAYASAVYQKIVTPYAANGKDPVPAGFQQFYTADAGMINPGFERPLRRDELPAYYTALKSQIRNLQLHLERWAARPGMLFIEWTVTGEVRGQPLVLPNTDRFTLREMLATQGVAYFDDLAVRAMADRSLARFNEVSFANLPTSNT